MSNPIILASSSIYRQQILSKLPLSFASAAPNIDESAKPGESVTALVERLAIEKAQHLAAQYPQHLIIGSDQVCVLNQQIQGKPHTHERAIQQLRASSGQVVSFYTGLALYNSAKKTVQSSVEIFKVHFRKLNDAQIERYLQLEQPYQCAGSFMCEGAGISLFKKLEGDDPNTLVGLPLIRLCDFLINQGVEL